VEKRYSNTGRGARGCCEVSVLGERGGRPEKDAAKKTFERIDATTRFQSLDRGKKGIQ